MVQNSSVASVTVYVKVTATINGNALVASDSIQIKKIGIFDLS